jgi:hypothetical protein
MSVKLLPTFVDRGCRVVSATDPKAINLDFRDTEPLLSYSSSFSVILTRRVEPVPDPLFLRKSDSTGIEPGISGSVARNSDH